MWVWWWFIRLVKLLIGGIAGFLHAVVLYPRAAIPVIMIVAGYIWYQMPSTTPSDAEEKAWDAVLEHGRWSSYSEKVKEMKKPVPSSPSPPPVAVIEKPKDVLKPRPSDPPPVASTQISPEVEARIPPEIKEFMYKRLDQIKSGQPLRQPATLAKDQKVTVEFDMAFLWEQRQEYFRENPTSRQSDFVLICAPVLLNGLDTVPSEVRNPQYYRQVLDGIVKDFTDPQGWGHRAMMSRKWAVIYFDPWQRIYPNPLIESVSRPPVRWDACDGRFDNVAFNRNYLKLTTTQ